jgi:tetratricopeptide (TPR) repeat protein
MASNDLISEIRLEFFLPCILLLVLVVQTSAQANTSPQGCNTPKIVRLLYDGKLRESLVESQNCAEHYRDEVGRVERKGDKTSLMLEMFQVGYWLCAEAQIQTMLGNTFQAESGISAAETWQKKHSLYSKDGVVSEPFLKILAVTKGLFFEKKGDLATAERFYSEYESDHAVGRLAVLSLRDRKYDEASRRAKRALLSGKVPTAHAVLATIAERDGDREAALNSYETALRLMGQERDANQFLPIYFAERDTVVSSIERLKGKIQANRLQ